MKKFIIAFLCLLGIGMSANAAATLTQLTSISDIDEDAEYVLGIAGTGMHISGTSSWGICSNVESQWLRYKLVKSADGTSFKAYTIVGESTYYLQIPTSNTFSMSTSTSATNSSLIIGTTQITGANYAVANSKTTTRHLRINGTSGLRSYASTTGDMAFFYKIENDTRILESIDITVPPTKLTYEVGETLDTAGCVVTATYDDESTETVSLSSCEFSPTTLETVGTQTITVTYLEKTATFDVTVNALPVLVSIAITTPPTKTIYEVGETLDTNGCVVTATYDISEPEDVTSLCTFTPMSLSVVGTQTITVAYSDKTATFDVTVNPKSLPQVIINPGAGEHTITSANTANMEAEKAYETNPITLLANQNNGSTSPKYVASGGDFRIYAKGSLTISTSGNNMKKIVFFISAQGKKRLTDITPSTGTTVNDISGEIWKVIWEGDAQSVTFTVSEYTTVGTDGVSTYGQLCFTDIDIFDKEYLPAGLEFSAETATATLGREFTEPTLTKETDAEVTYASSDETVATVNPATGEVTPTGVIGTTTITASAEATETYAAGEASYVLNVIKEYSSLAAWIAEEPKTTCPVMAPATAVFQWGATPESNQYLYITDGTSWMLVYGKFGQTYTNGNVIPAGYAGKYTTYNGLPEMAPAEGTFLAATEQVDPVQATEMSIGSITTANINQYVKLKKVDITNLNNKTATITDGTNSIELYNNFSLTVSEQENATVIGFVSYYEKNGVTKLQIYPTEIIEGAIKPVVTVSPGSGAVESGTTVDVTVNPADATIYYMTTTTEVWPEEWTAYDAASKPTITEACSYRVKAESAQEAGLFSDEVTCEYTIRPEGLIQDILTSSVLALSGSYKDYKYTATSGAVYEGCAMNNSAENNSIQLNSGKRGTDTTNYCGIFTTTSICDISSISVDFAKANGRTVTIYLSNEPFDPTKAASGTKSYTLTANGTIDLTTETEKYQYFALVANGACYINSVTVDWVEHEIVYLTFEPESGSVITSGDNIRINLMDPAVANVNVSINDGAAEDYNGEAIKTEEEQRYIEVPIIGEEGAVKVAAIAMDEDDVELGSYEANYRILYPKDYRQVMDVSHIDFDADYVLMYTDDSGDLDETYYVMGQKSTKNDKRFASVTSDVTFAYDVAQLLAKARENVSVITFEEVPSTPQGVRAAEETETNTKLVYVLADGKYLTCAETGSEESKSNLTAEDEPGSNGRSEVILSIAKDKSSNISLVFKYTTENETYDKPRGIRFNTSQKDYWGTYAEQDDTDQVLSKLYIAAEKLPVRHFGKIIDFVNYADAYIDEFPRVVPQEGASEAVQGDNGVGPKGLWAIDSDMTVVYADNVLHGGRDVFVQDETGGLMLYEKDITEEKVAFAEGDVLHGIQGQIDCTTQGVPRLLLTGFDETAHDYTAGEEVPEAMEITIAQLADNNNNILHNGKAVKLGYITADFTKFRHSEGDEEITNYNADGENFHYVIGNGLTKKDEDNVHVVLRHHTIEGVLSSDEFGYNTDELWPNSGNGEGGGSPITVIRRDGTQTVVDNLFEIVGVAYNNIKSKLIYAFGLTKSGAPVLEAPQFGGRDLGNGRYALDMVHDFADICDFYYVASSDPSVTDVDPTTATKFAGRFNVDLNVTPYVHAVAVLNPALATNPGIWTPSYDAPGSLWDMASGPSQIVRRDGETTVKTAKSLVATFKEGTPLGIDEMTANNVNILPVSGGVRVVGYDGLLRVFSISGMELVNATIHGDTYVELPAGMVIVVTEPVSAKVLVK